MLINHRPAVLFTPIKSLSQSINLATFKDALNIDRGVLKTRRKQQCIGRNSLICTAGGIVCASSDGEDDPTIPLADLLSSGNIKKSGLAKLKVAELRQACTDLGIDAEGTKLVLIDRLLELSTTSSTSTTSTSQQQQQEQQPPSRSPSTTSNTVQTSTIGRENSNNNRPAQPSTSHTPPRTIIVSDGTPPGKLSVTWLGTSSGSPTSRRNVSSIAVKTSDRIFLVDCGEGTRNQLRTAGLDPALVSHIFITHLHGDHCFGIAGALSSIGAARKGTPLEHEPIIVYGPRELQRLLLAACKIAQLSLSCPVVVYGWALDPSLEEPPRVVDPAGMLKFGLKGPDQGSFIPPATGNQWQTSYDKGSDQVVWPGITWSPVEPLPGGFTVTSAQLQHRMPCWGYVFQEVDTTVVSEDGGSMIRPGRKLVILGDTMDSTAIADVARGCDLISHEATFNRGMEAKALIASHSTAEQAGAFARSIRAKSLVLTHFSARYEQVDKISKSWAIAKAKGVSVGELNAGVAGQLLQEARGAAGPCKVYLANDYYTFNVPPRDVVEDAEMVRIKASREQPHQQQGLNGGSPTAKLMGSFPGNAHMNRGGRNAQQQQQQQQYQNQQYQSRSPRPYANR